jgi:hypothetical protein
MQMADIKYLFLDSEDLILVRLFLERNDVPLHRGETRSKWEPDCDTVEYFFLSFLIYIYFTN